MSLNDYLIDHKGIDWSSLLAEWTWLVPNEFTLWMMNRFGDLFMVFDDESVHMLDVGNGTLIRLAKDRDDFATKVDEDNNANEWFLIPLVDKLVANGITLPEGKCYSYTLAPILGGDYTVENIWVAPIAEHIGVHGSIHKQIKDLPDGTQVTIEVTK